MQLTGNLSLFRPVERPLEVLPGTRLLAAFIVPFLVAAAIILIGVPTETERFFAWPIGPTMSAMTLGAAYVAGVVFFTRVILAKDWDTVTVGFPPVIGFASLLGVTTVLHWDRFTQDHVAFWTWAALYFTTPVLVLLAWLRNLPASSSSDSAVIAPGLRAVFAALGIVTGLLSLGLFLFPDRLANEWPWTLSPLTARVLAATFLLPALLNIGIATRGLWKSSRIAFEAQAVALVLILAGYARATDEFTQNDTTRWLFLAGLILYLGLTVALYAFASRQVTAHDTGDE